MPLYRFLLFSGYIKIDCIYFFMHVESNMNLDIQLTPTDSAICFHVQHMQHTVS